MNRRMLTFVLLSLLLATIAFAQEYPNLRNAQIHASIMRDNDSVYYYYAYTLANDFTSAGKIDELEIDISRKPGTIEIDTIGLRFESYGFTGRSFRRNFPFSKGKITPVGFLATPEKWVGGLTNNSTATFFNGESNAILPGQSLAGFEIMSKGLPSIRRCIVSPFFDFDSLFSEERFPSEEDIPNTDSIQNAVKFYGWTVGPTAPPIDFIATVWLDTLASYTFQSRPLGWITNQAAADKYLSYFSSARAKLVQGDSVGARTVLQQVLRDVDIDSTANLTSEAYALLKYNTEYLVGKLPQAQAVPLFIIKLISSSGERLTGGSLQYYEGGWKDATNNNDGTFTIDTKLKTITLRMTYAYSSQTKSDVVVGADTAVFQTVSAHVQLQNSQGALMDTGTVQYYAGAWRSFGTTVGGIASKELLPSNYSFRMTYAYASKDKQQDIGVNPTVVFQTVNASVQLKNSQGSPIDQGAVQYYSGAWREFGVTANGVVTKELLPNNYSFRMTYAYASNDKQRDIGTNPTVVFQTVNASVQLQNSQGTLMDQGTVQYYSGAWRNFGITASGVATKELLPNNYSFRMTYVYASKDKQQDIGANPTVVFQTVNASVQLQNSQGTLMDQGTVQYYSGAWREFGVTTNGVATKELLPNNYSFRMTYAYASKDKQQDIGTNPSVVFQTVNASVQLQNSQGSLIDQGTVQYYSGAWRGFGVTANGIATKELLPNNYTFRMTYEFVSNDKVQDISANSTVSFSTVLCTVRVKDTQNRPVDGAQASYYSGAWRQIGATVNGEISKELLPANLTFRITYGTTQQDKTQNLSTNNVVEFSIQP
ncbi:MAG: hypothetical protein WBW16_12620 [Bacteroidota bacterium]